MSFISFFTRKHKKRFPLSWGGGLSTLQIDNEKYADAIISSIFDLLFVGLRGATWTLTKGQTKTYAEFIYFYRNHFEEVVTRLYQNGYIFLRQSEDGTINFTEDVATAEVTFYSADYRIYGVTTKQIIKPICRYLDNILNACNTSIKRLGVMVMLAPKTDEYGNTLTEDELKAEELKLQRDYGILDDQRVIKLFNHSYDVTTLNIGGQGLNLENRYQTAIKIICGKLRVPYELIPSAIIGNPNQTGVYQKEAQKRLFQTIREYLITFQNIAAKFGLLVDFDTPDAPQDYETASEQLTTYIIANIKEAESNGYIDHETAVKMYKEKILKYEAI